MNDPNEYLRAEEFLRTKELLRTEELKRCRKLVGNLYARIKEPKQNRYHNFSGRFEDIYKAIALISDPCLTLENIITKERETVVVSSLLFQEFKKIEIREVE